MISITFIELIMKKFIKYIIFIFMLMFTLNAKSENIDVDSTRKIITLEHGGFIEACNCLNVYNVMTCLQDCLDETTIFMAIKMKSVARLTLYLNKNNQLDSIDVIRWSKHDGFASVIRKFKPQITKVLSDNIDTLYVMNGRNMFIREDGEAEIIVSCLPFTGGFTCDLSADDPQLYLKRLKECVDNILSNESYKQEIGNRCIVP